MPPYTGPGDRDDALLQRVKHRGRSQFMIGEPLSTPDSGLLSRRTIIKAAVAVAGAAALAPRMAFAAGQGQSQTGTPPSVITNPPRQWGPDAPPELYPDPGIITIDPPFNHYPLHITAPH